MNKDKEKVNKKLKIIYILIFVIFLLIVIIYAVISRYKASFNNENSNNNKKRNSYSANYNTNKDKNEKIANGKSDSNSNDGEKLDLDVIEDTDPWGENAPIDQEKLKLTIDNDEYSYFLVKQCLSMFHTSKEYADNIVDSKLDKNSITGYFAGKNGLSFFIDKIYKAPIRDSKDVYYIYYRLQNKDANGVINKQIILKIDKKNVLFSVYPYEYLKSIDYLNLKENDKISLDIVSIDDLERNNYNKYNGRLIKKDDLIYVQELIDRTKFEIKYDRYTLFDKVDEEYKQVVFENDFSIFETFLNNKIDNYFKETFKGYQIYPQDNFTQYIAVFENTTTHFVFNKNNLIDYTIQFDNYSVALPPYLEIYEENYPHIKAKYCIDRIRKAINDKNYRLIYSKLNSTQKSNYYKDYNRFETFIKTYFYKDNVFDYGDCIKFSDDLYQYTVKAKDSGNSLSYNRKFNMTVELKDDGDFRISITL